jgi:preprotein translocase subunit SecE
MKEENNNKMIRGQVIVFIAIALGFIIVFGGDWILSWIRDIFSG